MGATHVRFAPPFVGVATRDPTRPGTPPTARIPRRCEASSACTAVSDEAATNSGVGSAADDCVDSIDCDSRRPASARYGFTVIASDATPRPASVRARTLIWYSASASG